MTTALMAALPAWYPMAMQERITVADLEADRAALAYIESHVREWERDMAYREYRHALHCGCHHCKTRAERLFEDNGGFLA